VPDHKYLTVCLLDGLSDVEIQRICSAVSLLRGVGSVLDSADFTPQALRVVSDRNEAKRATRKIFGKEE